MKSIIKKTTFYLSILVVVSGCLTAENNTPTKKTSTEIIYGADSDQHGCKGSAGFIWSQLLEECIQIFESGIPVNTNFKTDATMAYYVVFKEENSPVELFTPEESILLQKQDSAWIHGIWKLTFSNTQWQLEKQN